MKRKIISFVSAVAAALVLLTGCGAEPVPYERKSQPDVVYSKPANVTVSSAQSVESETPPSSSNSEPTLKPPVRPSVEPVPELPPSNEPALKPDPTAIKTENGLTAAPALSERRETVLDTKSEEFVAYTTGNGELNFSNACTPYLFDFRTRMAVGYSLNDTKNQLPVEADYGLKGEFNGSVIRLGVYNNTEKSITLKEAYLEALDVSVNAKEKLPPGMEFTTISTDLGNDPNGLYRVSATFSNDTTVKLYYIINGDEFMFCEMIVAANSSIDPNCNINMIRKRREHLYELLDEWNVTPENSLDVNVIKYPYQDLVWGGRQVWRCDTDKWANLSDEIVDPSWSDERKAFAICDWMSQNLAYDEYVRDVIDQDRDHYHSDYMGDYSVWVTRSGVCRDFGQILAIMLRQQGIPAEVIANDTHIWNIAYLNGKWMEIDICYSNAKVVKTADYTVRTNSSNNYRGLLSMLGQSNNNFYGTSLHEFLYTDRGFVNS